MRMYLFLAGLALALLLLLLAVLLWRRFYRDDPQNAARRIFKNSAVPLALRLLVRALDLVFAVVLLSTLPPTVIGPYTIAALLVAQYLGTVTEFGLGVLLTREVARDAGAARRLFGVTLLLRLLLVVVAAAPIAALLIAGYGLLGTMGWGEAISPEGQQAIWILLLTLVPSAYAGAVTALYNASERMEVPAVIEFVTGVLSFATRIAVIVLGFGILGLAWAAVLVSSITALIFFVLQRRDFFPPTLAWDSTTMRWLLPTAFPLMLNNLLSVVFFRFDTFIIKALGPGNGDLLVQQYNAAYLILNIALILPPVVIFAVFPTLARRAGGERAALAAAQNRTLQALWLLAFPLAAGLSVLSPDLVRFFTRANAPQYMPIAAHVLLILAWFLPFSFLNGLVQYVLIAINQQGAITRAFLIGAGFNLVANLLLVPRFGLYAASLITIMSELVLFAVFLPRLRREGLLPPLLQLAWRPLLAALFMALVMLLLMARASDLGWGAPLLAALVAPLAYAGALTLLGAIGQPEVALVRRVIGR
ncbi:MAG: flippase [Chloroflexaceae bacterium]|nr:flippase [Chloroflexaceae bacterium]